jgi:hypothetical protein
MLGLLHLVDLPLIIFVKEVALWDFLIELDGGTIVIGFSGGVVSVGIELSIIWKLDLLVNLTLPSKVFVLADLRRRKRRV